MANTIHAFTVLLYEQLKLYLVWYPVISLCEKCIDKHDMSDVSFPVVSLSGQQLKLNILLMRRV